MQMPSAEFRPGNTGLLAPLGALSAFPLGLPAYYRSLLDHDDELLRIGALMALLDLRAIAPDQYNDVLALCRLGGVKIRAFDYFQSAHEPHWAEKVASVETANEAALVDRRLSALLRFDNDELIAVETDQFLASGRIEHLRNVAAAAETSGGWKMAAEWAIRTLLLAPIEAFGASALLEALSGANQYDLVTEVCRILKGVGLNPTLCAFYDAQGALNAGDAKACLHLLAKMPRDKTPPGVVRMMAKLRAEALDKRGEYREAYQAYLQMHKLEAQPNIDPRRFYEGILGRARLPVPALPPDPHGNYVFMLGFPRSGTTLLENALAAHPLVETFEEIPSMSAVHRKLSGVVGAPDHPQRDDVAFYEDARERYAYELERRKNKPGASVFVDKMPIRSGEAQLLSRLFPDRRSIFSIRHPFDVVLSCLKQSFKPNVAMANLYNVHDAAKVYDFVMTQWFDVYSMDDPRVFYVRYDLLVTDFEQTMSNALEFLGLKWDDKILDFARKAEERRTKTPSYKKVRSGLTIGVQSSWQNYRFLFDHEDARPLHKWAAFFGYETS